jgi:hypothetical protein
MKQIRTTETVRMKRKFRLAEFIWLNNAGIYPTRGFAFPEYHQAGNPIINAQRKNERPEDRAFGG